jgi:hypothetical protein
LTLSCFVGGHLLTEASAVRGNPELANYGQLLQRYFIAAEPNIYVASALFLFVLVILPYAYETDVTRRLRPLLVSLGVLVAVAIVVWLGQTIHFIGVQENSVGLTATGVGVATLWLTLFSKWKRSKWPVAFLIILVGVASTEVFCALTADPPRNVLPLDVYWSVAVVSTSIASIVGTGIGVIVQIHRLP